MWVFFYSPSSRKGRGIFSMSTTFFPLEQTYLGGPVENRIMVSNSSSISGSLKVEPTPRPKPKDLDEGGPSCSIVFISPNMLCETPLSDKNLSSSVMNSCTRWKFILIQFIHFKFIWKTTITKCISTF